jgi:fumarate reductase flavoprotein subunit
MIDIVVVGAGGCGLMAALVAGRLGATVLVLEKTQQPGGGTALSHKGLRAAGSRYQKAAGIPDSPEQYMREILDRNGRKSHPEVTERLTNVSGRMIAFLADEAGVDFYLDDFSFGQGARRSHTWSSPRPITDFLFDAVVAETNVEMQFSTPAVSLYCDSGGEVAGVVTSEGRVEARKVILASGGFAASSSLLAKYIPKAVGIPFPGHVGSTGEGIEMGLAAGGVVENMSSFQPYPAHVGPGKRGLPPGVILSGGIMVDRQGHRFVNETHYPGGVAAAILDLPDRRVYEVFDQRILDEHRGGSEERGIGAMAEAGLLTEAGTPEALAQGLGIDPSVLSATIEDYNAQAGVGTDVFGRSPKLPLVPPLFAIEVTVAIYHTQGGLRVTPEGEVVDRDGSVIPNLYAGGGVAAGLSGDGLDGYLPGNGLLASLGLGMVAAEHAVRSLAPSFGSRNPR